MEPCLGEISDMRLSIKYWKFHMGRTIALLSAVIISTMAMTAGVFLARSASQTNVEKILDSHGDYDIVVPLIEKEQLDQLADNPDIARFGSILNGGTCKTKTSAFLRFGAMDSQAAEELFHYAPEKGGRYPLMPGEICGYRSSFEDLGVAAVVGNSFELTLYDSEGNDIVTKEFTIVGVLNDQRDANFNAIRTMDILGVTDSDNINFPELFVSTDEVPSKSTLTALILCDPDASQYDVTNALKREGIDARDGIRLMGLGSIAVVDFQTENELYERAHLSYNDFYSSYLIPAFLCIVLAVSFISIYGVMSGAMLEREKQLGLLRTMGLSKAGVVRTLFGEAVTFCLTGVAIGYGLGVLIYILYIQVINAIGDVYIYSAFGAHPIAKAVSLNPYVVPWLLGIIFSVMAAVIPLIKQLKLSPNEMLSPEKTAVLNKKGRKLKGGSIIRKVVGKSLTGDIGVVAVILITGWMFVFGGAFMMAQSDFDNMFAQEMLEQASTADADYSAVKNLYSTMWANVLFNRHNEGVAKEDMDALKESSDVAEVWGVIRLPGLKLLYSEDEIPEGLKETLDEFDISHNMQDFLQELEQKSKEQQGYAKDDLLYSLPATALDDDLLEQLLQYKVVSGEIDREGMKNGTKIVIAEYGGEESKNPYKAGDRLTLTDAVISDEFIEAYDFSTSIMPEGYEESFRFDYTDGSMTDVPGYSFGEKVEFEVEVCAVISVDDKKMEDLLDSEGYVMKENGFGYASAGYGIVCSADALSGWGLPDGRYTDVYVNLTKGADMDRFETLWYTIIGNSGNMNRVSRSSIKRRIASTELSNMVMFASMIVLIILIGCFGMANTYSFALKKNMKNIQIMRAVGMSRKGLIVSYVKGIVFWPLIAALTSVVPLEIFDLIKKYAYHYAFDLSNNSYIPADNGKMVICWQALFPWYIEMWKQPVIPIMIIAFIALSLVNIGTGIVPMNQIKKISIVEGIRNDSF